MSQRTTIACILAAALALAAFLFLRKDEKARVRECLEDIMEAVEKTEGEGNIAMAAKHQTLLGRLDQQIQVYLQEPPISQTFPAEEIMAHYVTLRRLCTTLELSADDISIALLDNTHATLTCYGTATFRGTTGKHFKEARPAILTFIKKDGKWLLATAKEHKVFK